MSKTIQDFNSTEEYYEFLKKECMQELLKEVKSRPNAIEALSKHLKCRRKILSSNPELLVTMMTEAAAYKHSFSLDTFCANTEVNDHEILSVLEAIQLGLHEHNYTLKSSECMVRCMAMCRIYFSDDEELFNIIATKSCEMIIKMLSSVTFEHCAI